jgi:hypothetical protein
MRALKAAFGGARAAPVGVCWGGQNNLVSMISKYIVTAVVGLGDIITVSY